MLGQLARAQSGGLIEALRVHRPEALTTARAELSACTATTAPDGKSAPCPDAARLSLLSGFLMLSSGDAPAAVAQLTSRAAPKGLEAFHAWYLGEALAWSHEPEAALKSFAAVPKSAPEWLKKKVELRKAELLLDQGKAAKALPVFEGAEADSSPELLYERGLARLLSGQTDKGVADLKAVMVRFPAHPHAALAQQRLEAVGKAVTFSVEERFARESGFLGAADPKSAAAELDAIAQGPRALSFGALLALARSNVLFAMGQDKEAQAALEGAFNGPASVAAEALMLRARKLMRAGDNAGARRVLLSVDEKYTTHSSAEDAGYLAAWIAMQAGDFASAVKDFETFEERHPGSKKRDEARWFRAYSQLRLDKWLEARATLQSLLADFNRSSLIPQASYWAARAAQLSATKGDAGTPAEPFANEYRALIGRWSGSFYALLSQERLRELGVDPPPTFTQAVPAAPAVAAPPPELKLAGELARAGLLRDAWEETQSRIANIGANDAIRFGRALQSLGEFGGGHTLAARYLWGAVYGQKNPEAIALMYPRAYRDSVERLSRENGLDPFMCWAIMRRESAFKPEVTSIADARGLLQLIPPTARSIASVLKITAPEPDELYAPETSIGFGTWYLAALMDRFSHPTLCAAAYNAGATPVLKWAASKPDLPLDMWIEEIPYKETRAYVKQVTADYFIYRALYGDKSEPAPRLVMTVPAPRDGGVGF